MTVVVKQYTIYDHPRDAPEHWVVREWGIVRGSHPIPGTMWLADSLEDARKIVPPEADICLTRDIRDHPTIVETWI